MSLAEIIEELPRLTPEERRTIYQQIERLDGEPNFEPTPEMLGAIEEGIRSAQTERMYTAEEIKDRVHRWAISRVECSMQIARAVANPMSVIDTLTHRNEAFASSAFPQT